MKNKILNLIKSAVWFVLCLFVGALIFEGIRSLANSNEPAKKIGMSVFTEERSSVWKIICLKILLLKAI